MRIFPELDRHLLQVEGSYCLAKNLDHLSVSYGLREGMDMRLVGVR